MIVRLHCNRTLRRWLCRLRNPNAMPAASLIILFVVSVRALVMPVSVKATCRYQAPIVLARVMTSGTSARAHQS
jgi:hypothetical protein